MNLTHRSNALHLHFVPVIIYLMPLNLNSLQVKAVEFDATYVHFNATREKTDTFNKNHITLTFSLCVGNLLIFFGLLHKVLHLS